jgi:hypothetical protein
MAPVRGDGGVREHADYEDVCLVEAILKGEEIGRKENQQ